MNHSHRQTRTRTTNYMTVSRTYHGKCVRFAFCLITNDSLSYYAAGFRIEKKMKRNGKINKDRDLFDLCLNIELWTPVHLRKHSANLRCAIFKTDAPLSASKFNLAYPNDLKTSSEMSFRRCKADFSVEQFWQIVNLYYTHKVSNFYLDFWPFIGYSDNLNLLDGFQPREGGEEFEILT
jgi:hypothetical protein